MTETICGKSCSECSYKRDLSCPGCQLGPGSEESGTCSIARCCRSSRRDKCQSCAAGNRCANLQSREQIPRERLRQQKEEQGAREDFLARGRVLRKLMWVLMILSVPDGIAFLLSTNLGLQLAPYAAEQAVWITVLTRLAIGLILLVMGTGERRYRTAGWFSLAGACIGSVSGLLPEIGYILLLLAEEYFLFSANEAVMDGRNERLSLFWGNLWKWRVLVCIDVVSTGIMRAASTLPSMLTVLVYSAYLAVSALGYILLLSQLFEQRKNSETTPDTVVVFSKKLPVKLISLDYFGTALIVVLLVAFGLLKYTTLLLTLLTTAAIPLLLLNTAQALPKDTTL